MVFPSVRMCCSIILWDQRYSLWSAPCGQLGSSHPSKMCNSVDSSSQDVFCPDLGGICYGRNNVQIIDLFQDSDLWEVLGEAVCNPVALSFPTCCPFCGEIGGWVGRKLAHPNFVRKLWENLRFYITPVFPFLLLPLCFRQPPAYLLSPDEFPFYSCNCNYVNCVPFPLLLLFSGTLFGWFWVVVSRR